MPLYHLPNDYWLLFTIGDKLAVTRLIFYALFEGPLQGGCVLDLEP